MTETTMAEDETTMAAREIRLYIGGLSERVTEQDIKNTFSKLGFVRSVDFITSKARSFAYINFSPSSDNSLHKLFSTYNGCAWKGGKLKLEKAKEHYMDRLKREWAEEAELKNRELINHGDVDASLVDLPEFQSTPDLKTMELRVFFPKLRKVKPLPLSGTGKHKYSFRRLEAPPVPVHICDCPEHSVPVQTRTVTHTNNDSDIRKGVGIRREQHNMMNSVVNKYRSQETSSDHKEVVVHDSEMQDAGLNEEEINMMDSVIKKLLDGGTSSKRDRENPRFSQEKKAVTSEIQEAINGTDEETDDDDIKINTVAAEDFGSFFSRNRERQVSLSNDVTLPIEETNETDDDDDDDDDDIQINAMSMRKKQQTSLANEITQLNEWRNQKIESSNRKRKSVSIDTNVDDFASSIHEKKGHLKIPLKKPGWKQLVGDGSSSSFTLSQITSENDTNHENQPKLCSQPSNIKKSKKGNHEDQPKPGYNEEDDNSVQITSENDTNHEDQPKPSDEAPAGSEEHKEDNHSAQRESQSSKRRKKSKKARKVVPEEPKPNGDQTPAVSNEDDVANNIIPSNGQSSEPAVTQGSSWLQRSTWTQLVGGDNSSSFSISQILPEDLVQKQTSYKPDDSNTVSFSFTSAGAFSKEQRTSEMAFEASNAKKDNQEASTSEPKLTSQYTGVQISDICPFMRNAESLKEWMTAKTATSNSLKKIKNK